MTSTTLMVRPRHLFDPLAPQHATNPPSNADVLDQFQPQPASKTPPAPSTTADAAATSSRESHDPATGGAPVLDPGEENLEEQLRAGMQNLMGELGENPEMQAQFEQMMQELIAAGATGDDKEAGQHLKEAAGAVPKAPATAEGGGKKTAEGKGGSGSGGGGDFNETIRRTMERMQASGDAATAASASGGGGGAGGTSEEDLLAQMMRELQGGGEGGGEEDFNKMLMSMMTQLTNKEILYEPMKELDDKFPAWLRQHEGSGEVAAEDMARYREQRRLVGEIVGRFERPGYRDENEGDWEFIVERMQKVSFGCGLAGLCSLREAREEGWASGRVCADQVFPDRCKPRARRRRISWAICRPRRRRWAIWMPDVHSNETPSPLRRLDPMFCAIIKTCLVFPCDTHMENVAIELHSNAEARSLFELSTLEDQ